MNGYIGTLLFLQLSLSLKLPQDKLGKKGRAVTEAGSSRHSTLRGWTVIAGAQALASDGLIITILL